MPTYFSPSNFWIVTTEPVRQLLYQEAADIHLPGKHDSVADFLAFYPPPIQMPDTYWAAALSLLLPPYFSPLLGMLFAKAYVHVRNINWPAILRSKEKPLFSPWLGFCKGIGFPSQFLLPFPLPLLSLKWASIHVWNYKSSAMRSKLSLPRRVKTREK